MQQNSEKEKKEIDPADNKEKRMPVWKMAVIDVSLTVICLGVFMLFDYILPQTYSEAGQTITSTAQAAQNQFTLPEETTQSSEESASSEQSGSSEESASSGKPGSSEESTSSGKPGRGSSGSSKGNRGNTNTTDISVDAEKAEEVSKTDKTVTEVASYSNDQVQFTVEQKTYGTGSNTVTYYTADIYVTNVSYLLTAFAEGTYGKNIKDTVLDMAAENNAILALSGDFYGNSEEGVVIRNGVLYRSDLNDADICVLFTDGTMKTYAASEFDADAVIAAGAWQAWTFGPALLDGSGNVLSSFNTTSYLNSENPRAAIGYVEPGHYVMMVVDGRSEGYSRGVTLSELAGLLVEEGCQYAYNLDGGKSSAMVYNGAYVNQPADGGREISDIIMIGE